MTDKTHLTTTQVATLYGVNPKTVVRLAERGELPCIETPLGRLYPVGAVERLALERAAEKVPA
jgi:excisionase family DNA binding protein